MRLVGAGSVGLGLIVWALFGDGSGGVQALALALGVALVVLAAFSDQIERITAGPQGLGVWIKKAQQLDEQGKHEEAERIRAAIWEVLRDTHGPARPGSILHFETFMAILGGKTHEEAYAEADAKIKQERDA